MESDVVERRVHSWEYVLDYIVLHQLHHDERVVTAEVTCDLEDVVESLLAGVSLHQVVYELHGLKWELVGGQHGRVVVVLVELHVLNARDERLRLALQPVVLVDVDG